MRSNTPPGMGMPTQEKKHHRCLTCCIICFVIILLFVGLAIGGSAIAFNKFVSPMIGGVKFGSAIRLLNGVYNGERQRKKILTNTYTEEDLSDFYDELNMHLFQQVRAKADLEAEFAALSADEQEAVLAELKANAKWAARYDSADDKGDLVKQYYVSANRYPITIAKILSVVDLDELTATADASTGAKAALGEYLSTDPVARIAQAAEAEEQTEENAEQTSTETEMLAKLFSQLHFDFRDSGLLGQFVYTEDENYPANVETVTFDITGNQIAALVGEVASQVLGNANLTEMMGSSEDIGVDLSKIYLPDYVLIPQVVIEHKSELPANPTQADLEQYNKNTYASITLEVRIRSLLNNAELQSAVKATLADMVPNQNLVNIGWNVVKGLLPKTLFLTVGVYPLDSEAPAFVKINNYNEKLQKELAKLINSIAGDANIFDSDTVGGESTPKDGEDADVMQQINARVVSLFNTLDERGIPLNFVDQSDGKSVGLRLAHVQMLLQFMHAYDPQGVDGITPYLFMTVLKCLFSTPTMVVPEEGDLDALYDEIEDKYGIADAFWQDGGLLNVDNLQNLPANIDLKGINFRDNQTMRVNLLDRQLLALFVRAKEDGSLDKLISGTDRPTAAAADGEDSETDVGDIISGLNFSLMKIRKVNEAGVFSLSVRATLSISDILEKFLEEEQSVLSTIIDAIPDNISFGITVYLHADEQGNITYVGADSEGNYNTDFLINAFDETYTRRVIETISTLMRCMGAGDGFDTAALAEKVNELFQKVIDMVKDNLYCDVGIKDGALCLPSLYELVQAFGKKRVEGSETLSEDDLLEPDEIREVLQTVYHPDYTPAPYTGTPGDDMLRELQSKYYLAEAWTAADLFGGEVDLSTKITADSLNFRDPVDELGNPLTDADGNVIRGLYHDERTLDQLKVNIAGSALADLLAKSGKLGSIADDGGMLKSLNVVDCTYSTTDEKTFADFIFRAGLVETAAAEEDSVGFSVNDLLPDNIYLTANILLYQVDGDYTLSPRFTTELVVNGNAQATDNLFKLIKVFSGEEFDRSQVTSQVSDAVNQAFETIEDNVNFDFGRDANQAMRLENVFNTINKISNKPTAAQLEDPAYVAYQSNPADDEELQALLREFGRDPASTTGEVVLSDASTQNVVYQVDVDSFASTFGIVSKESAPNRDDEKTFFNTLNQNYYIAEDKALNAERVNSGDLVVDETFISLAALYSDTRPYSQLTTNATDKQIAALIDAMYSAGIEVKDGSDLLGTAKILAVHISAKTMQTFVQVTLNPEASNARLLPANIYLSTVTYLNPVDDLGNPLTDAEGNALAKYSTTFTINDLGYDQTDRLFGRLNKLSQSIGMDFSLQMDTITAPIEDNIQAVFEDKLSALGDVQYAEGKLVIPSIFAYLAGGKLVDDHGSTVYDKSQYMVDIDIAGDSTYYATHSADTDPNKTDPESLMYRMREFGKADVVANFANNMVVWSGGRPAATGAKYNTNTYTAADEKNFYDQLQVYYFFAADNRPNSDWFKGDTNIFNDLTNHFDTAFNLDGSGYTAEVVQEMQLSTALANYATTGLYRYNDAQIGAKLSDKALASLINSQNAITVSAPNIDSITVTSVELGVNGAVLSIRITVEVQTQSAATALPTKFYMTTSTIRDATNPYDVQYTTDLTINRFALPSADYAGDLAVFINNLAHIDALDIKSQLDTDAICQNVTDALQDMLDNKLADYVKTYGNYADGDTAGKGYIEFNNIYHEIVNQLDINRATYQNADEDIQQIIYKLHNVNRYISDFNNSDGYETVVYYDSADSVINDGDNAGGYPTCNPIAHLMDIAKTKTTDRAFANLAKAAISTTKNYVDDVKSVFFVDDQEDEVFGDWAAMIAQAKESGSFAFADGATYVLATVRLDMTDAAMSDVSASVALLPDYIYASVVVRIDTVNTIECTFLNDFSYEQTQMLLSKIQNSNKMDVENDIRTIVNANLSGMTFTINGDADYTDYVGEAEKNF